MSKFQKGDKVRCVSKEHTKRYWNEHVKYLEIGRVYTVSYVDSPYDYCVTLQEVDTIEPDGLFYHEDDFVPAFCTDEAWDRAMRGV